MKRVLLVLLSLVGAQSIAHSAGVRPVVLVVYPKGGHAGAEAGPGTGFGDALDIGADTRAELGAGVDLQPLHALAQSFVNAGASNGNRDDDTRAEFPRLLSQSSMDQDLEKYASGQEFSGLKLPTLTLRPGAPFNDSDFGESFDTALREETPRLETRVSEPFFVQASHLPGLSGATQDEKNEWNGEGAHVQENGDLVSDTSGSGSNSTSSSRGFEQSSSSQFSSVTTPEGVVSKGDNVTTTKTTRCQNGVCEEEVTTKRKVLPSENGTV